MTRSRPARTARTDGRRRLAQLAAPAAIAAAGAALYLADAGLRAPFSGIVLVGVACSLIAIGFLGRGWAALLVAVAAVELPLAVWYLLDDESLDPDVLEAQEISGCDPSCGISLGAAMLVLLPVPLILAAAGWVARALLGRIGR